MWCKENKITLVFIQPGNAIQNAYVERCNGNIRSELLNAYVSKALDELMEKAEVMGWGAITITTGHIML